MLCFTQVKSILGRATTSRTKHTWTVSFTRCTCTCVHICFPTFYKEILKKLPSHFLRRPTTSHSMFMMITFYHFKHNKKKYTGTDYCEIAVSTEYKNVLHKFTATYRPISSLFFKHILSDNSYHVTSKNK